MLFSDIEGSTVLLRRLGDRYGDALSAQRAMLRSAFSACGGQEMGTEGDSFFVVFASAGDAVRCCVAAQRSLSSHDWPGRVAVRVRMGLHSGEPVRHEDGYVGLEVHRAARIAAAAHGGQVVLSEATRLLVESGLPTGVSLRDLGFYQLKDLEAPERIYQLVAAGLPEQFPPLKSLGAGVAAGMAGLHGFPAALTSLVGRSGELDEVADLLARHRLVTVTGPGGVGKTRLASAAARRVADRFADGAWLAELAPVRDVRGVDDTVAVVFSVTARAGPSTRAALVEFLRGKQLLLVLDNCEHVLAGAATLAENLARSCERLVILATSREGLGIEGERLVPVPPLRVPGADADLAAITQAEAVRLFAERAAAVKPSFAVTALNAEAIAAVVRRLDGIALAIELAAARMSAMTPTELSRRLAHSFAVLAAGRRGAVARHQTLRATIDWSFQLLTEPEQRLLARLAVFAGGCTLQAVEAVCGGEGIDPDAVFELLAGLVARSLVVAEEHGPETRYRLLETIRQYGEECLNEAGESERWRACHAGYYADLLRQVRDRTPNSREEVFWAVRLSAEQDNLLAAWSWAISTGNVGTVFSILAGFAPVEIWRTYPLVLPGEAALQLPCANEHPGYPLALAVSAVFASNRADATGAEELCRRAAEANARQATPAWRVEATICAARQNIATTTGAFADAARLAEQAAAIARAGGDLAEASIEFTIAAVDHVLDGDDPSAVPLANQALMLARQIGDPALIATSLLGVGLAVASTDPGQARACLRESRELSTGFGYESGFDLARATGIAFLVGDVSAALELGRGAILGLRWGGDRVRMGLVLSVIAGALAAIRPDAAAIIQGAAQAYVVESSRTYQVINSIVTAKLGEERALELRARGVDMDWEQAVAYTLTQTTQALNELESETQPWARRSRAPDSDLKWHETGQWRLRVVGMVEVRVVRTGSIRIRPSNLAGDMHHPVWRRRLAILLDRNWTQPLPIYTYLIEHDEGLILLDSGESALSARPGWFPWWSPLRLAVDIHVEPGEEIGPRLRSMGIDPGKDLRMLVLSHLHHDHADGLSHFRGTDIVVSDENYRAAAGLKGALIGAVPSRWPSWFDPRRVQLTGPGVASFDRTLPLTSDSTVFAVPTPGHMLGHLSVVVRAPEVTYFLAGDATYDEQLLKQRIVDGASGNLPVSLDTLDRIAGFARSEPTVLLPAHDPLAEHRLTERITLSD